MSKGKKFGPQELANFCNQTAMMLKSGISLEEGMYMLGEEVKEEKTKQVLGEVEEQLKENTSFYEALKSTGAFPKYMVNMVRIGEVSGKLEEVMTALCRYYKRDQVIHSSIQNVVAYPMMMFGMIVVILAVLTWKILPMFEDVLVNLNIDAKSSSGKIMMFGKQLGTVVVILSALCILVGAAMLLWYQTASGRKSLKSFMAYFIVTKKTAAVLALGKFASSMSVMISSGIEPTEALEMAEKVVEHKKLQKKIAACREEINEERGFAEALREQKIFSEMQSRMISVADKTGMLDEVMMEVSDQYDEEIENQLGSFCATLETILVLFLSIIVGGVLLAVMFPMVSIITSIG